MIDIYIEPKQYVIPATRATRATRATPATPTTLLTKNGASSSQFSLTFWKAP